MTIYCGFQTKKQEVMYLKFTKKLIQVMSEELLNQSSSPLGLGFSKKIVKIYKAMCIMEK